MHKHFYASGFLYHSPTQKILLQQIPLNTDLAFTLFSRKYPHQEDSIAAFQKLIKEELDLDVPPETITTVYEYDAEDTNEKHCIFYADISTLGSEEDFRTEGKTEWFTLKQLSKLKLQEQIDHDIMIALRVIRASIELG